MGGDRGRQADQLGGILVGGADAAYSNVPPHMKDAPLSPTDKTQEYLYALERPYGQNNRPKVTRHQRCGLVTQRSPGDMT